jgi:hypothetical protein
MEENNSKYEIFVEAKDPRWPVDRDNLHRAWRCEVQRHSVKIAHRSALASHDLRIAVRKPALIE